MMTAGETYYAVIDYTLSSPINIGDTDRARLRIDIFDSLINAESEEVQESYAFSFNVEEFPIGKEDYSVGKTYIDASFGISTVSAEGKRYRFIVSVTLTSTCKIKIKSAVSGDEISFLEESEAVGEIGMGGTGTDRGLSYSLSADGTYYTVIGIGSNVGDSVTVPETYNGKPVKRIEDNALGLGYSHIKEIKLPQGLLEIGRYAFRGCTGLERIIIPSSVSVISYGAFAECDIDVFYYNESIPSGWDPEWAPKDTMVYYGCCNMQGDLTFTLNSDGGSYTLTGANGYGGEIVVPAIYDGIPVTAVDCSFEDLSGRLTVPYTVKTFNTKTKFSDLNLRYANIPACVARVMKNAKISELVLGGEGELTVYGMSTLTKLESVIISDGITCIGENSFKNCSKLKSVTIPKSVRDIEFGAFSYCTGLTEINFNAESCAGRYYSSSKKNEVFYNAGVYGDGITVIFGDSVKEIPRYLFYGSKMIKSVTIGKSVTDIGEYAFYGCEKFTEITIPDSVTSIGGYAFYGCSGLTGITIPVSVTSMGYSVFSYCTGLTEINFNAAEIRSDFSSYQPIFSGAGGEDGITVTVGDSVKKISAFLFNGCKNIKSVTIGKSVTDIGEYAFRGCTGLTGIIIPDSVTNIGHDAFYSCTGLTSVTIGNSVTSIGANAFNGCTGLTSVTIGNSVTSIGYEAFYNCTGLTSITIPNSVTSIGEGAFSGCSSLESITLPFVGGSAKTSSSTYQYPLGYIFGKSSYTGGTKTTQYYYGSSTSSTTSSTYYIPASLKSVTITGGNILYGAFSNCTGLTSITIPNSVTSIDDGAFYGCKGLTSITIPNGVTSIGSYAFNGCTGLTTINYTGTEEQWNSISKNETWINGVENFTVNYNYK